LGGFHRHVDSWKPIAEFVRGQGVVVGMQLAHAGRKASTAEPWVGGKPIPLEVGGWTPVAPSAVPFDSGYNVPKEMTLAEIDQVARDFESAAHRALKSGFQVVEIHAAHGYLLHEFYSPLSNFRKDEYGGGFDNRIRLLLRVAKTVREFWPAENPVLVRISATDWREGGWDIKHSVELCKRLKALGIDLVDVSSAGAVPGVSIPVGPGYQTAFAEAIRKEAGIATGTVGVITDSVQAETIIATGQADMVFLAREMLRDPYWPRRAAQELGQKIKAPVQYERAW
jgi:2,4-dienoyl-CoA reductase-like NADH-dependent reductase (Old Yellow Enzyme family)